MATPRDAISLGRDAIQRLVEAGRIIPLEVSPMATAMRSVADGGPSPDEAALAAFHDSIEIAARPDALIRLLIMVPDQEDEGVIGLVVRAGRAASFTLTDDSLQLGRAEALEVVVASLVPSLVHEGPLADTEVWLWPSVVQVVTGLWQDLPDPARTLSRAAVIEQLVTPEFTRAEAEQFMHGIVGTGAVAVTGDQVEIEPALRPWLRVLWSASAVQVEYIPLPPGARLEQAVDGPSEHLLFVGPPGQRLHDEVVSGEALQRQLAGDEARETSMLHLSAPTAAQIADALRRLVRIAP